MTRKIVFVTPSVGHGGAEKMLIFVANNCLEVFDEVYIISFSKGNIAHNIDGKIKLRFLNLSNLDRIDKKINFFQKMKKKIRSFLLLRKELKKVKPNIVCAFGVSYVLLSYLSSLGLGINIIGSERRSPYNLPFKWKIISKFVYSRCAGMVFQLKDAMEFYGENIRKKSVIIPNPYLSNTTIIPCEPEKREKTITAAAARLEFPKGFDVLIKAFNIVKQKHPDYKLIIYGEGNPEETYGDLIKKYQLEEYVEFPGLVNNVAEIVQNSTVFVLPSRYEGIPNTLIEVMGAGVPTVSCDCPPGGPRFLTDNGRRGLLVPVEDHISLAKEICRIIENRSLARKLSESSLEIKDVLSPRRISKKWNDYFKQFLEKDKRGI